VLHTNCFKYLPPFSLESSLLHFLVTTTNLGREVNLAEKMALSGSVLHPTTKFHRFCHASYSDNIGC